MIRHLRDFRENIIYLALWLTLFLAPVLSLYIRTLNNSNITFEWDEVFSVWKIYLIYLIVFIIHNFFLAPILVYRNKKMMYFATTACLFAIFVFYECNNHPKGDELKHIKEMHMRDHGGPGMDGPDGRIPPEFQDGGMMPGDIGPQQPMLKPDAMENGDSLGNNNFDNKEFGNEKRPFRRGRFMGPLFFGGKEIISSVIMFLLLGMNLGIKLYFRSEKRDKEIKQLEQENLTTQLEYLKYQINPHFFMNTLNNIHALVDIDPELAKVTILELSKMMRYILYEGNKPFVPLQKETEFLKNYIMLMKLRYTEKVKIDFDIPEDLPNKEMPPLLLINFIENAFKHGVSYKEDSFIRIELRIVGDRLYFGCNNSKHEESTKEHGGVGLTNVRKRLQLLYAENYALDIEDKEKTYDVKLDIPLNTPRTAVS